MYLHQKKLGKKATFLVGQSINRHNLNPKNLPGFFSKKAEERIHPLIGVLQKTHHTAGDSTRDQTSSSSWRSLSHLKWVN